MENKSQLLEKALASVPDTILFVDCGFKITKVIPNDKQVGITKEAQGYKIDALPGLSFPGSGGEQIISVIKECKEKNESIDYDFSLLMKDGMCVYLKSRITPVDDYVILYLRDQTDEVEKEKGEHHTERNYMLELALKKSKISAFSFSFDRFNTCDRVNCNRCFQFYGETNELLNRNKHICRALPVLSHPKDRKDFFFLFNNLRDQRMDEATVSFRLKDDNGEYRRYKVYGKVDGYDNKGTANLIVGSIVDNQEKFEYEQLKKKLNDPQTVEEDSL